MGEELWIADSELRKEGGGGVWNDNEWRVEKEKQMRVCMNHVEVVVPMQPPQALNDECDGGGGGGPVVVLQRT